MTRASGVDGRPRSRQLRHRVRDDRGLVVAGALEVRAADEREMPGQAEVLEDAGGRVGRLRRGDGQRQARVAQAGQQLRDPVVHLVLEQADVVVPLAVLRDGHVDVGVRHREVLAERDGQRRAEERADRRVVGMVDAHRIERVAQAVDDAGGRVGEGAVEVQEDGPPLRRRHGANMSYAGHVSDGSQPYACRVTSGASIEVVAHRGANDEEPEHSLAAYLKAVEQGADAIECDVRLTADGTLVCVHDRRIDRTSTGRGTVSAMTLEELAAYDYSRSNETWIDYEDPPPDETRTTVLTLQTLLATMLEASHDGAVRDRDEASDQVRPLRGGLGGRDAPLLRARPRERGRAARARHVVQPGCGPTRARAAAREPDRVPDGRRAPALPGRVAAGGRRPSRARRSRSCARIPHYVEHVHAKGGGCTSGRWTSRPTSTSAGRSAWTPSSPTARAGC